MKDTAVILHLADSHVEQLAVPINFRFLQIWQVQKGLAFGWKTVIPLSIRNVHTLIKSIDKVSFQTLIHRKIIAFLKGSAGSDISVGQREGCLIAIVGFHGKFCLCNIPWLYRVNWFLIDIHILILSQLLQSDSP